MTAATPITSADYSHDLLVHECDEELVAGIGGFVEQGLASGGQVLVHSTQERVTMLHAILGEHPRLVYGLDSDLYLSPSSTLFAYQRQLAESLGPTALWATGTVPLGDDARGHPAWARYESLVNEVLGRYSFHGLCTYDARVLPATTIAAARATHPCVCAGSLRTESPEYETPAAFLANPLAGVPEPPTTPPAFTRTVHGPQDMEGVRRLVRLAAGRDAMPLETRNGLVSAVNEVLANGLEHGGLPVRVSMWVQPSALLCEVVDSGPGIDDPMAGYRYPDPWGSRGLWVARQMCENVFVRNLPGGGCSVLLTTA